MLYLVFKYVHLLAIISWMAGILYLIRLFVNHVEHGLLSEDNHRLLSLMESRLYRFITFPAMTISWTAGLSLVALNPQAYLSSWWFFIKFIAVTLLTSLTLWCAHMIKLLQQKSQVKSLPSSRFFRILNELPTLLMMIIVGMVVFRPF